MIDVDEKELIRRAYFLQGQSMRRIARERRHSRHTVRRALEDPGPPVYRLKAPKPRPVLGPYTALIDRWLREDLERPPKQRHTARRVYDRLVAEHGFRGGASTVRQYVREHRPRPAADVPLVLDYDPGADAQVDWGEAQVLMQGRPTTVQLFCFRLCFSQRDFVMAFPRQRQEAFFAGHVSAFEELGGVPRRLTYDNLKVAVQRVLSGRRRQEQREFIAFRSHYLFESRFCTPGRAQEKGHVEGLVGYARRNFLVPLPEVASFEELNALLRERCRASAGRPLRGRGLTVAQAWEQERAHLLPLPRFSWPCCTLRPARASRASLVAFDGNRYSVPVAYAGRNLLLRAFVDRVELTHNGRTIARHRRSYEHGQDVLDPYHFLPALLRKPGAFHQARAVRQHRWRPEFQEALARLEERYPDGAGTKEFLRILALQAEVGEERLGEALRLALRYGCLRADAVRHLLHYLSAPRTPPPRLDLAALGLVAPSVPVRDVSLYNQLLASPAGGG